MFGNHGLCGLLEEGAHGKSPKCFGGNLGDFWGDFAKVSDRQRLGANVGFSFKSFKRPSESIFFRRPFVLLND